MHCGRQTRKTRTRSSAGCTSKASVDLKVKFPRNFSKRREKKLDKANNNNNTTLIILDLIACTLSPEKKGKSFFSSRFSFHFQSFYRSALFSAKVFRSLQPATNTHKLSLLLKLNLSDGDGERTYLMTLNDVYRCTSHLKGNFYACWCL